MIKMIFMFIINMIIYFIPAIENGEEIYIWVGFFNHKSGFTNNHWDEWCIINKFFQSWFEF